MAASRTLAQMRATVRQLADLENQTDWADDDELDERLNEWLQALYDKLISARGHEYYAKSTAVTLVGGTASYSLPSDFYELSAVIATDGSRYQDVHPWQSQELAGLLDFEQTVGSVTIYDYHYRIQAAQLEIRPKPTATGHTLELRYIPSMTRLDADLDTFDGVNGWERYACLGAAVDFMNKEESDSSSLQMELRRIEARIDKLAGSRDAGHPERIQDTRGDWSVGSSWER